MPKRYKMKVEVEFDCPATVPPQEAFDRFFSADRKVENETAKVLSSQLFKIPAKVNPKLRAHNEARRVMQVLIDQSGMPFKIIKGNRYNGWDGSDATSQFQLYLPPDPSNPSTIDYHWVQIKGKHFLGSSTEKRIDLSDPASADLVTQELKCTFWRCGHKDRSRHQ